MKIDLASARIDPVEWEETVRLEAAELGLAAGWRLSPIEVRGRLSAADHDHWLELDVSFSVDAPCDRCAEPTHAEIDAGSRLLVVVRRPTAAVAEEVQLATEDLGMLELVEPAIDSRPLVVELVQLELPTRPLCRDDCRGVCPRCGRNRNEGECGCEEQPGDPRWSALAELRDRWQEPN